jgi:hypothetical protein
MAYRFQNVTARLPFAEPATADVNILTLDRRSEVDVGESAFYYLHGSRNGNIQKLISGNLGLKEPALSQFNRLSAEAQVRFLETMKAKAQRISQDYFARESQFASDLAEFVRAQNREPFDLIVTVPTRHPELLEPYFEALANAYPQAKSYFDRIEKSKDWKSNTILTLDERVGTLSFDIQDEVSGVERLLIVDDVVARGETAAVVAEFLAKQLVSPPSFVALACPLWAESTINR